MSSADSATAFQLPPKKAALRKMMVVKEEPLWEKDQEEIPITLSQPETTSKSTATTTANSSSKVVKDEPTDEISPVVADNNKAENTTANNLTISSPIKAEEEEEDVDNSTASSLPFFEHNANPSSSHSGLSTSTSFPIAGGQSLLSPTKSTAGQHVFAVPSGVPIQRKKIRLSPNKNGVVIYPSKSLVGKPQVGSPPKTESGLISVVPLNNAQIISTSKSSFPLSSGTTILPNNKKVTVVKVESAGPLPLINGSSSNQNFKPTAREQNLAMFRGIQTRRQKAAFLRNIQPSAFSAQPSFPEITVPTYGQMYPNIGGENLTGLSSSNTNSSNFEQPIPSLAKKAPKPIQPYFPPPIPHIQKRQKRLKGENYAKNAEVALNCFEEDLRSEPVFVVTDHPDDNSDPSSDELSVPPIAFNRATALELTDGNDYAADCALYIDSDVEEELLQDSDVLYPENIDEALASLGPPNPGSVAMRRFYAKYAPLFEKYIDESDLCDCQECIASFFRRPKETLSRYGVELSRGAATRKRIKEQAEARLKQQQAQRERGQSNLGNSPTSQLQILNPNSLVKSEDDSLLVIRGADRPARDSYGRSLLQTIARAQFKKPEDDEKTRAFKSNLVETVVLGTRLTPAQEAEKRLAEERACKLLDYTPGGLPANATLGNPLLYLRPHSSLHPQQHNKPSRDGAHYMRLRNDGSPYNSDSHYEYHFECKYPGCQLTGVNEWNMRRHIRTVHLRFPVTKRDMIAENLDVAKVEREESKYIQATCTVKKTLKSAEEIRKIEAEARRLGEEAKERMMMSLPPEGQRLLEAEAREQQQMLLLKQEEKVEEEEVEEEKKVELVEPPKKIEVVPRRKSLRLKIKEEME